MAWTAGAAGRAASIRPTSRRDPAQVAPRVARVHRALFVAVCLSAASIASAQGLAAGTLPATRVPPRLFVPSYQYARRGAALGSTGVTTSYTPRRARVAALRALFGADASSTARGDLPREASAHDGARTVSGWEPR